MLPVSGSPTCMAIMYASNCYEFAASCRNAPPPPARLFARVAASLVFVVVVVVVSRRFPSLVQYHSLQFAPSRSVSVRCFTTTYNLPLCLSSQLSVGC